MELDSYHEVCLLMINMVLLLTSCFFKKKVLMNFFKLGDFPSFLTRICRIFIFYSGFCLIITIKELA